MGGGQKKTYLKVYKNTICQGKEEEHKFLKVIYDDLCNTENKQDKESFSFKNRLKVIHEKLRDLEWKRDVKINLSKFVHWIILNLIIPL